MRPIGRLKERGAEKERLCAGFPSLLGASEIEGRTRTQEAGEARDRLTSSRQDVACRIPIVGSVESRNDATSPSRAASSNGEFLDAGASSLRSSGKFKSVTAMGIGNGVADARTQSPPMAASTRGGEIGRSVKRVPVAAATAFATHASGGTIGVSPTPRTP